MRSVAHQINVEEVCDFNLLGISLDTHLTWKTHVQKIKSKLSKFTYALSTLTRNTHQDAALSAYYAYAYSYMRYGVLLWGDSVESHDIFILQKKCIRILYNIKPRDSCKPYFIKEKILTFPSIFILEAAIFVRKNINDFNYVKSARRSNKLELPKANMEIVKNGPHYKAVKIYNKIPDQIKNDISDKPFQTKLKAFLLSKSYYSVDEFLTEK